jgi:CHAT domain-containing protein
VQAITALYPGRSLALLGADATERRARGLAGGPRLVHFATHALLDRRFPLDSALALSAPARAHDPADNGLLQAWEIMEKMRLNADLVTLSACETGLGRDAAGEGIVGLTRAFQFAGARSVLASLWPVSEGGTANFMESFYRELSRGRSKDEALQRAQQDAIRAGRPAFEWAAFQLTGDWK